MYHYALLTKEHLENWPQKEHDSLVYSEYLISLSNLAFSNMYRGRYDEVEDYLKKAIDLAIARFGENSMVLRSICISYNAFYNIKGEYGKGEEYLKKALRLIEINDGIMHPKMPGAYWNLGLINEKKGDYEQAARYYQKSADISILQQDRQGTTRCYDRIGTFHQWKGNYRQAIENFDKILAIVKENPKTEPIDLTFIYLRLAAVYLEMGDAEKANEYFALAPEIKDYKTIGRNHFNIESSYSDLGDIYLKRKEFDKAGYYYQKFLEIVKHYRGLNHIKLAEVYNQIGKVHLAKGEPDSALIASHRALSTLLPGFPTDDIALFPEVKRVGVGFVLPATLALKAEAFTQKYHQTQDITALELALKGYRITADFIDLMRSDYLTEASKQTLAERARSVYSKGLTISIELYEKTTDETYLNQALGFMEKSKSILLLEAVQKSRANEFAGISNDFLSDEQRIKTDLAFYEKMLFEEETKTKPDSLKIENYKSNLFSLRNEYDQFIAVAKDKYPEYYQLKYDLSVADIASIQNRLDDQSMLIEYFFSDSVLWTLGVSKDNVVYNKIETQDDFFSQLESLRNFLKNNPSGQQSHARIEAGYKQFVEYGSGLYNLLLKPVLGKNNPARLIIIPDGQLGYLPFQILLTREPETLLAAGPAYRNLPYLVKDMAIGYEYSSSILLTKPERKKVKNIYSGFAPVYHNNEELALRGEDRGILEEVYDETVRNSLYSLQFNQPEVKESSDLIGGKSFLGTVASEQAFKANAEHSRILHLAMHALTNDKNPLYSQLIFSESADSAEDGNLYAYELYNMQLNADLTVLSACNTGVGKLQSGEGIMSLARAFKYAGCPNIVMSLWKANDESTKEIMVDFHKNLKMGEGKGGALRNAKLNFLATCDQKYTHPYYWATFVLIGDNEPIDFGRPWWVYALIGVGGLAFLIFAFKRFGKEVL